MRFRTENRFLIIVVTITAALCVSMCNGLNKPDITHIDGRKFAGSESCVSCHKSISENHRQTAHFNTSKPLETRSIRGNFTPGNNTFVLSDQLKVEMIKTKEGFFQVGYVDGWEAIRKPMEVAIGSGRKAQTYLYWQADQLFELPVSYYTPLNTWCNSPGYPSDRILFDRAIPSRCFECHGTFAKTFMENKTEKFDKDEMIYGIDCERCHGPAAEHVDFHSQHPEDKSPKFIINLRGLSRQLKLDNCALCHSGIRTSIQPSFSFTVGHPLDDFSKPDYALDSAAALDVHGNQYGLLTASECFRASDMDCSSCHDVHKKETENLELSSQRCMNCHKPSGPNFCTQPEHPGLVLSKNCIDCHMPALPSSQVFIEVPDRSKSTPDLIRTHLVGIYKDQVKTYLEQLN